MKKYNLLKVIGITIIVAMLLTFFIPGSSADYSGKIVENGTNAVGVWALLSNMNIALSYFSTTAVYIVAIAIFYSVLSKLDSYNSFVEKSANAFKGKENTLVTISIIVFGILAALVSNVMVLLVFVPYMYNVMTKLSIDKKAILASTIIASLVGAMCAIYNETLFSIFSLKVNTLLLVKIILLVISLFVLVMFIAPKKVLVTSTKEEKKAVKATTKKVASKTNAKKSTSKTTSKKAGKKVTK